MTTSEKRIYRNKIRRNRELKRNILKCVVSILLIIVLSIGGFAIGSKAQSEDVTVLYKYFTNIEVKYGESLLDIANTYFCEERYKNQEEYISEVMLLNGLYNTEISPGSYLIVPYYSSEYK